MQSLAFEISSKRPEWAAGIDRVLALQQARAALHAAGWTDAECQYVDYCTVGVLLAADQRAAFRLLVDTLLSQCGPADPYWIHLQLMLAGVEDDEERWSAARVLLDRAREALYPADGRPSLVPDRERSLPNYLGTEALYWIDLGVPELARAFVEQELQLADAQENTTQAMNALDHQVRLALAEDDQAQLQRLRTRLADDARFQADNPRQRDLLALPLAVGLVEAELRGLAPVGGARRELENLLANDQLDSQRRGWARMNLALVALDQGQLEVARASLSKLRAELEHSQQGAQPLEPRHRLALALLALEARLAVLEVDRGVLPSVSLEAHLQRLQQAFGQFLDSWSGAPVRGGGLAYLYLSNRHLVPQELIELELRVHGPKAGAERACEALLRAQAMGSLSRRLAAPVPTVAELSSLGGPGRGGVLLWFTGRDRSYVFAVDQQGLRCERLAAVHTLEGASGELLRSAQRALRDQSGSANQGLLAAAERMSRLLLPVGLWPAVAGWESVTLSGLDALPKLPTELLRLDDGRWLGASLAVVETPSLPLLLALSKSAPLPRSLQAPGGAVRALLAPELSPQVSQRWQLSWLDPADPAWARMLAPFGAQVQLLCGPQATLAALVGADAPLVLTVVCHGIYDPQRERGSGLALADSPGHEGPAWAEDLARVVSPGLVVLGVCGAERGPLRAGDDDQGDLGGVFLAAGAQAVVLSRTDLELQACQRILEHLNRGLCAGLSPAEALRRARDSCLAAGEPLALQALLLHVVGNGHAPLFVPTGAEPRAAWPWALVGLGLLAGLAVILARIRLRAWGSGAAGAWGAAASED